MKKDFQKIKDAAMLSKLTKRKVLDEVFIHSGYAAETLINGNISHCIEYIRELTDCGKTGIQIAFDELEMIKQQVPERYNFIKASVFNPLY